MLKLGAGPHRALFTPGRLSLARAWPEQGLRLWDSGIHLLSLTSGGWASPKTSKLAERTLETGLKETGRGRSHAWDHTVSGSVATET